MAWPSFTQRRLHRSSERVCISFQCTSSCVPPGRTDPFQVPAGIRSVRPHRVGLAAARISHVCIGTAVLAAVRNLAYIGGGAPKIMYAYKSDS